MALTRLEGDANDLLAWLVANMSRHPGSWEVAALHSEVPSFSTERINGAVALLEERGFASATRYLGTAPYEVGVIDLTVEGKIEGERLNMEGEASRRRQQVRSGADAAHAAHVTAEHQAGSATSVPALSTITLTVAEQRVLDVVADFELAGHEPTLMEHVRLHVAPEVAADPAAIALAMVATDLLETDVWKKKLYLTPKGLLLSRHGATAERLALALRAYLIARINQQGVGFKRFEWKDLLAAHIAAPEEFFASLRIIDILKLHGPGGGASLGTSPGKQTAHWSPPEEMARFRNVADMNDVYAWAEAARPHRVERHESTAPMAADAPPTIATGVSAEGAPQPPYEPVSKIAEEILLLKRFRPFAEGFFPIEMIVQKVDASTSDVSEVLAEFEKAGLVSGQVLQHVRGAPKGRVYTPDPSAWTAREHLMRRRGLRHWALVRQRECSLRDLVVAIVMSDHIENSRSSEVWDPKRTPDELAFYLADYSREELLACCAGLVANDLLIKVMKHRAGRDVEAFDITARGRRDYETRVTRVLLLGQGESILDAAVSDRVQVFDAWQSECKPARNMIEAVLPGVIAEINAQEGLVRELEIVQATAPGEGAIRIDVALQEKIRKAHFFVGDVTPVYAYGERLRVNENVLVETGFALASKEPNQIILLAMVRDDVPGDASNAQPAFDIAHVRRHEFKSKDELRRKLRTELEAALRTRGFLR